MIIQAIAGQSFPTLPKRELNGRGPGLRRTPMYDEMHTL